MVTISASHAKKELYSLMDKTAKSHEPVMITGQRANVVMLSEEDWQAVEETIYLNSVPGLVEELIKRRDAEESEFSDEEDMAW